MPTIELLRHYTPAELQLLAAVAKRRKITIFEAEAQLAREQLAAMEDVKLDKDGNVIFLEQGQ